MPQVLVDKYSETSCVVQMGKPDQLVEEDTDDILNNYNISEYAYTNRELVNLENANVNIDNSSDVIIGPVTQFNVNGNVTIVQNGQSSNSEEKDTQKWNLPGEKCTEVKFPRQEKSLSEDHDSRIFLRKTAKKVTIGVAILLVTVGIILTATLVKNATSSDSSSQEIIIIPQSNQSDTHNVSKHTIFTKTDWGGRASKNYQNFSAPPKLVIVKHIGAGEMCKDNEHCAQRLQTLQSSDMANGLPDIYASFFIGGDGNIYVGRGWDAQPAYRKDSIDLVFMGNFDIDEPTKFMTDAAKALLEYGMKRHKLDANYVVVCHNQTMNTRSPGVNVIKDVKTWPHYDSGLYFRKYL